MKPDKLFSITEAARITGVSVAWWRQRIFQKEIRFVKMGRRVLIKESTIKDLIEKGTVDPDF